MSLTNKEMQAKLEALEERLSLLSQTTDSLEQRLEQAEDRWVGWMVSLRAALAALGRRMDLIRKRTPLTPAQ